MVRSEDQCGTPMLAEDSQPCALKMLGRNAWIEASLSMTLSAQTVWQLRGSPENGLLWGNCGNSTLADTPIPSWYARQE